MRGIPGMGGMRPYGRSRDLMPMKGIEGLKDLGEQAEDDEKRLQGWASRVGEERARIALDVLKSSGSSGGYRSTTLPELLAEGYLRRQGAHYEAQYDLGWARPDFVVWGSQAAPAGVLVIRVQGDYWHAGTAAKDAAQKAQLLTATVRGSPILSVMDVWESRIYQSDAVMEAAMRGEEFGQ
jgi:hypothetical protein